MGYPGFKPGQAPIVRSILRGHDVLAVEPTGFGKTLCFSVTALLFPGTTIVISSNIALMERQVADLNKRMGTQVAACITSDQGRAVKEKTIDQAAKGLFKLLYVAPERFCSEEFQTVIEGLSIPLLVVDEAHSILLDSTYRENYLKVGYFAMRLGIPQIAAFTATCPKGFFTKTVSRLLWLRDPKVHRGTLNRPNLYYTVRRFEKEGGKWAFLLVTLQELYGRGLEYGLIYCSEREFTKKLSEKLNALGYSSTYYHAELSPTVKRRNQDHFIRKKAKIMVATKAFGQGIDIPDIRFTFVYNTPANIIELAHLWGRAGRNDEQAYCFLLHTGHDRRLQEIFLEENQENLTGYLANCPKWVKRRIDVEKVGNYLNREHDRIMAFANDTSVCIRRSLLKSQGRKYSGHPKDCCGNCR